MDPAQFVAGLLKESCTVLVFCLKFLDPGKSCHKLLGHSWRSGNVNMISKSWWITRSKKLWGIYVANLFIWAQENIAPTPLRLGHCDFASSLKIRDKFWWNSSMLEIKNHPACHITLWDILKWRPSGIWLAATSRAFCYVSVHYKQFPVSGNSIIYTVMWNRNSIKFIFLSVQGILKCFHHMQHIYLILLTIHW